MKTKVVFRFLEDDVIALFYEEPSDYTGYHCMSYMSVGQHCGADPMQVVRNSRPACPDEYASLKAELENVVGYELAVRQRIPRTAIYTRRNTIALWARKEGVACSFAMSP